MKNHIMSMADWAQRIEELVAASGAYSRKAMIHIIGSIRIRPDIYIVLRPNRVCKTQDRQVPAKAMPNVPIDRLNELLGLRPASEKK